MVGTGAQLLDNNGEGGDSIDAHITWQHGESLLWTVPRDGVVTEYIRLIFREIDELVVNRTAVAMLVDVRATDVPNAASRAEIVAGVNALADSLCGLALLTGQSVRQKFVVQVSRFMMTRIPVPFRMFTDMDEANAWLKTTRESASQ